jgi:hypothetical protein
VLPDEAEIARCLGQDWDAVAALQVLDQHHLDPFGVGHLPDDARNGGDTCLGRGGVAAVPGDDHVPDGLPIGWCHEERLDDTDPDDAPGQFGDVTDVAPQIVFGGNQLFEGDEDHGRVDGGHREVLLHPWRSSRVLHCGAHEALALASTAKAPSGVEVTVTPVPSSAQTSAVLPPRATARAWAVASESAVVGAPQLRPSQTR